MRRYGVYLNFAAIFILSLLVYYFYGLAWPLAQGRDYENYIMYYLDLPLREVTYPVLMLYRTPIPPLVIGASLEFGGPTLLEAVLGICYSISVLSVYYIGLQLSQRTGWIAVLAMWIYPPFAIFMHTAASDSILGFAWTLWCAIVFWTMKKPTVGRFVVNALMAVVLTLIRPGNMLPLIPFAAFPFLINGLPWRSRLVRSAAYLAPMLVLLLAWQSYNYARYGQFTIARGQNAVILYRVFVNDHLVRPTNGPASQEFLSVVEADLLTKEPYQSYGITLEQLTTIRSPRVYSDLVSLADRHWGWHTNYKILRQVTVEAVLSHFPTYVVSVIVDILRVLATHYAPEYHHRPLPPDPTVPIELNDKGLPVPTEGELIPHGYQWWLTTTPDGTLVPQDKVDALNARVAAMPQIPTRDGSEFLAKAITTLLIYGYPSMLICLAVGLLGLVILAPKGTLWLPWSRAMLYLLATSGFIIALSMATIDMVVPYRLPFDPLFIVFAVAGLVRDFPTPSTSMIASQNALH